MDRHLARVVVCRLGSSSLGASPRFGIESCRSHDTVGLRPTEEGAGAVGQDSCGVVLEDRDGRQMEDGMLCAGLEGFCLAQAFTPEPGKEIRKAS